jgi:hypothetical protein
MVQTFSCRSHNTVDRFRSLASSCDICLGQSGTGMGVFSEYFCFPVSVSLHQCSILMCAFKTILNRIKTWGPSMISGDVSEIGRSQGRTLLSLSLLLFCLVRWCSLTLPHGSDLIMKPEPFRSSNVVMWDSYNDVLLVTSLLTSFVPLR